MLSFPTLIEAITKPMVKTILPYSLKIPAKAYTTDIFYGRIDTLYISHFQYVTSNLEKLYIVNYISNNIVVTEFVDICEIDPRYGHISNIDLYLKCDSETDMIKTKLKL